MPDVETELGRFGRWLDNEIETRADEHLGGPRDDRTRWRDRFQRSAPRSTGPDVRGR